MKKYIIWDFNGTLIDDVDTAVLSVNDTFDKLGIPRTEREEYRRNMDMPIYKYYEKHADLTKIPLEYFTKEFLAGFEKHIETVTASPSALYTVRELSRRGAVQCIISSFEQKRLEGLTERFGFTPYMDGIFGASDILCLSKTERGKKWMKDEGADPADVLVVGDMVHDFDMAAEMGASCVLYDRGHQPREALEKTGTKVISDLKEILK